MRWPRNTSHNTQGQRRISVFVARTTTVSVRHVLFPTDHRGKESYLASNSFVGLISPNPRRSREHFRSCNFCVDRFRGLRGITPFGPYVIPPLLKADIQKQVSGMIVYDTARQFPKSSLRNEKQSGLSHFNWNFAMMTWRLRISMVFYKRIKLVFKKTWDQFSATMMRNYNNCGQNYALKQFSKRIISF